MLAIRNISLAPYLYNSNLNRRKVLEQSQQPNNDANVYFTGDSNQKSSKFTSYAGGVVMGLLSLFGFSGCGGSNSGKYYDVYITYNDLPGCSDTIKMENGCSFEVIHTKYLMHKGKLWAYDKDKKEWRETPDNVMVIRSSQDTHLKSIASACNEEDGVTILSKDDIKYALEHNQEFEYNSLCIGDRKVTSEDNVLSADVGYGDYREFILKFRYDDDMDLQDKN